MKLKTLNPLKAAALTGFLCICLQAREAAADCGTYYVPAFDEASVMVDVIVARPLGLVTTVVGTGLFLGLSPLTALAAIPEPHDAFSQVAEILIEEPATFTFVRPLGCFTGSSAGGWY